MINSYSGFVIPHFKEGQAIFLCTYINKTITLAQLNSPNWKTVVVWTPFKCGLSTLPYQVERVQVEIGINTAVLQNVLSIPGDFKFRSFFLKQYLDLGYWLNDPQFNSLQGQEILLFSEGPQVLLSLVPIQFPAQWVSRRVFGWLFRGGKMAGA